MAMSNKEHAKRYKTANVDAVVYRRFKKEVDAAGFKVAPILRILMLKWLDYRENEADKGMTI